MTSSFTDTFNRDDIRRVYASFAADYKIVAEWTGLHAQSRIEANLASIRAVAEEQYLKAVHLHLRSALGIIKEAAVYRVSSDASGWSADRPGDLYWDHQSSDELRLVVYYSDKWWALTDGQRETFKSEHLPGWGASDFDGTYDGLEATADKQFASRAYGMERTRYRS